jgi:hypothetical protein
MVLRGKFGPKREIFSPRWFNDRGLNLITHRHLVPRLRVSGAIPLFPYTRIMRGQ